MHIAYFDEAGDDGFPSFSSPLFALSACYLHHLSWKPTLEKILDFRRQLKATLGLPVKVEVHMKYFLLDKNPYRQFGFSDQDRIQAVTSFCDFIAELDVRFVNAVIAKPRILSQSYNVLDWSLKLVLQRIENDLDPARNPTKRFLMISDEGRVGKMRDTTRRLQRINYIPSRFGGSFRQELRSLIEDPLPKNSRDSYFIQLCDLVAFVVYVHCLTKTGAGGLSNRLGALISPSVAEDWMNRLKPSLNLAATGSDPHGIVIHPS